MNLLGRGRPASDPEARLVAAASRGDTAAFDQLRAQHEPAVTEFCAKMLEHRHPEAPGVAAETFATARRELRGKDAQVKLRPWLYALAFERCVARLDDERPGGAVLGQGEPDEQQRGAALMVGALPHDELVSVMGLAGSRPALFGLVSELGRAAPGFLGSLALDQAAGQAVAALGVMPTFAGSGGEKAAKHAAGQFTPAMTASAQAVAKGADRVWNGARIAAATAGVVVVGGATAFAVTDPIGTNVQRGGAAVQGAGGASATGAQTPGTAAGLRGGESTGGERRAGASSGDTRQNDGARAGRDGRDGAPGPAGSGSSTTVIRERVGPANAGPGPASAPPNNGSGRPGAGGPGDNGPGAGDGGTRDRSLIEVDANVGSIEVHVKVP